MKFYILYSMKFYEIDQSLEKHYINVVFLITSLVHYVSTEMTSLLFLLTCDLHDSPCSLELHMFQKFVNVEDRIFKIAVSNFSSWYHIKRFLRIFTNSHLKKNNYQIHLFWEADVSKLKKKSYCKKLIKCREFAIYKKKFKKICSPWWNITVRASIWFLWRKYWSPLLCFKIQRNYLVIDH